MSKIRPLLAIPLTVILISCGGGGSNSSSVSPETDQQSPFDVVDDDPELAPEPTPTPTPELTPEPTPEPITGQELVGDLEVEGFSERGIDIAITRYGYSQFGDPEIGLRLNNNSINPLYNASCDITALRGDLILDVAKTFFASLDPIDSGESAIDNGVWWDLDGGFGSFDKIRIECDWIRGDGRRIDTSGPVSVEFTGYRTSSFNQPAVALLLTNNSSATIYNAYCGVEAKRGNLIVDVASVFFASLSDIRSGEAVEEDGAWLELSSLDEFETEPFNIENVNCTYLVRRVVEEPVVDVPTVEEPVIEEPAVEEPVIEEPIVEAPTVEEPIFSVPTVAELDEDGDGDVDCSDFASQREAQRFFNVNGPGDPHRLDGNGDGIACQSLP